MEPITLFRWIRAPHKPFSDQRNCQTAGPSLRMTIARLPRCIVILLRHGLAQENLQALRAKRRGGPSRSELLCGGNVVPLKRSGADNFRLATTRERRGEPGPVST